jgi:hypothetical protein
MTRSQARARIRIACGWCLPRRRASAYSLAAQGEGVPGVVGEGMQRGSCSPVGGPAEPDRPGLAGGSGDRGGTAFGDGLLGVVDTLQDGADLGDQLGEVDLADAGHGGKQLGLGMAEQASTKGSVEVGDGGKQGTQQPDLGADQLGEDLRGQTDRRGGNRPEPVRSSAGLRPPR